MKFSRPSSPTAWRRACGTPTVVDHRLHKIDSAFRTEMPLVRERATIPFNHMAEWGDDGRILPAAPVYSPFVRSKKRLKLD
jgi:NAD(P)H dehydrogenase (quinone)